MAYVKYLSRVHERTGTFHRASRPIYSRRTTWTDNNLSKKRIDLSLQFWMAIVRVKGSR